jgi:hypothetical protein
MVVVWTENRTVQVFYVSACPNVKHAISIKNSKTAKDVTHCVWTWSFHQLKAAPKPECAKRS